MPDQPGGSGDAADVPCRESGCAQKDKTKGLHGDRILDDEKDAHEADQDATCTLTTDGQSTHDSGGVIVKGEDKEKLVLPDTTRRHMVALGNRYGVGRQEGASVPHARRVIVNAEPGGGSGDSVIPSGLDGADGSGNNSELHG